MASAVDVKIKDFRWFREVLVRSGDLIEALHGEELSEDTTRKLRSFEAALHVSDAESDESGSDLLPP